MDYMFEILEIFPASEISAGSLYWIELASLLIEWIAVVIIVFSVLFGSINFVVQTFMRKLVPSERFVIYKRRLGRALLLGLEILVAADVIRTVALEPTLRSVSVLGLLVLIRTFLSWSLVVEIEGRWPWQPKSSSED